jgi:hypothetical protein
MISITYAGRVLDVPKPEHVCDMKTHMQSVVEVDRSRISLIKDNKEMLADETLNEIDKLDMVVREMPNGVIPKHIFFTELHKLVERNMVHMDFYGYLAQGEQNIAYINQWEKRKPVSFRLVENNEQLIQVGDHAYHHVDPYRDEHGRIKITIKMDDVMCITYIPPGTYIEGEFDRLFGTIISIEKRKMVAIQLYLYHVRLYQADGEPLRPYQNMNPSWRVCIRYDNIAEKV